MHEVRLHPFLGRPKNPERPYVVVFVRPFVRLSVCLSICLQDPDRDRDTCYPEEVEAKKQKK